MIVTFVKHQEGHQNVQTNIYPQTHFRPKDVAKYITPNSDVDNLSIRRQKKQKKFEKLCNQLEGFDEGRH